jgi:hypothetical protein
MEANGKRTRCGDGVLGLNGSWFSFSFSFSNTFILSFFFFLKYFIDLFGCNLLGHGFCWVSQCWKMA